MTPATNERHRPGLYLADFSVPAMHCREHGYGFAEFRRLEKARQLRWPDNVLEQWIFDHAGYGPFRKDYGEIDLTRIHWPVEGLPVDDFMMMPTGPSDHDALDRYEADPNHAVAVGGQGVHVGVKLCWEVHGTWKRWPSCLIGTWSGDRGFQLVEGRTRVGVLRGRGRQGSLVADRRLAWVGRRRA